MMRIALQETLLTAHDPAALFEQAAALGVDGIEISGIDLESRIEQIALAASTSGVSTASIHYGKQGALLSDKLEVREHALDALRANIACAVDLGAAGVIVVPHYGGLTMPDLSPWMSPGELHAEMLHMHLRTLSDFCHALGTKLLIQPARPDQTAFITRLEQAGAVVKRIKHPDVLIAADLGCLLDEGGDPALPLGSFAKQVGYVSLPLADLDRVYTEVMLTGLRDAGYTGWITLTGARPDGDLGAAAARLRGDLAPNVG